MDRRFRNAVTAILIGLAFSLGAESQPVDDIPLAHYWKLCTDPVVEIPPFVEWVPVGCEAVDCCPGCPGILDKLKWRIQVVGRPIESVALSFKRLPRDVAASLQLGGTAQGVAEKMVVGNGEGFIAGLPVEVAGRAPVARLTVTLSKSWSQGQAAEVVSKQARALATPGTAGDVGDSSERDTGYLVIEQFLGRYRVNEFKVKYQFQFCRKVAGDRIVLHDNTSSDSASLYVDANRAGGCVNDEPHRGSGVVSMGDLLPNGACRSEVVVFSDDDAMQLVENVTSWTQASNDTLDVNMTPRLMAPVSVWVARPGGLQTAIDDVDHANLLYNSNNSGIGFTPSFHDVSNDANATAIIGPNCASDPSAIEASAFYTPGQLNVYYVTGSFTGCVPDADYNVASIGTTSNNQTLAHEFGHSMGLGHTNGSSNDNIMVGGGQNRTHFYDGQSFRMNAHCGSSLNKNGVRVGPMRHCYDDAFGGTAFCPAGLDHQCLKWNADASPK